jgi:hypothetical protein
VPRSSLYLCATLLMESITQEHLQLGKDLLKAANPTPPSTHLQPCTNPHCQKAGTTDTHPFQQCGRPGGPCHIPKQIHTTPDQIYMQHTYAMALEIQLINHLRPNEWTPIEDFTTLDQQFHSQQLPKLRLALTQYLRSLQPKEQQSFTLIKFIQSRP